ncbi:MAG: hypothetical protein FJY11_01800 [Bacteroidetes bacterium]|nr:hypothetical protein [Bacteroidota bacterium]
MKTSIITAVAVFAFAAAGAIAQVPQGFNYQALAMNSSGEPIPERDIRVRIAFLSSVAPETVIWEEEHNTTTGRHGLFSILVGDPGALKTGGTVDSFKEIPWSETPIYLRTRIDYDSQWHTMGTTALASVPYSLVTGTAMGGTDRFSITGSDILSGEPLFEVKRKDGVAVFSVYNTGARINVPVFEEGKASKGGFAIGGFDESKAYVQDFMLISPDSVRIFIDDINPVKASKGGFAIGGFDPSKAGYDEYMRIMPDCTRIYVKESAKASKGGFAIGSFDESKAEPIDFMNVNPLNYFIGHESGKMNLTGKHNSFLGYQAGMGLTSGEYNVFLGHKSGISNNTGSYNVYIGNGSGFNSSASYYGTFMGHNSGYYNTGWFNSYFGCNAGFATISGSSNTFIGLNAGRLLEKGSFNTFIGTDAGEGGPGDLFDHGTTLAADNNTALGFQAGNLITGGDNNVFIGSYSGAEIETGSGNVFIGHESGRSETGSNKLYITNSDTPSPLLYGDFSTLRVGIATKNLTEKLNVDGNIAVTGTVYATTLNAAVNGNVTGKVNGITMGKIFLQGTGTVAQITELGLLLAWNYETGVLFFNNTSGREYTFWCSIVKESATERHSGIIRESGTTLALENVNFNTAGIEVHFGEVSDSNHWCSVWLQYFDKKMIGHYTK